MVQARIPRKSFVLARKACRHAQEFHPRFSNIGQILQLSGAPVGEPLSLRSAANFYFLLLFKNQGGQPCTYYRSKVATRSFSVVNFEVQWKSYGRIISWIMLDISMSLSGTFCKFSAYIYIYTIDDTIQCFLKFPFLKKYRLQVII